MLISSYLRRVHVNSVSMVTEAAVQHPVFMEETLEVQRHFFPFCCSFLVLTQKPLTAQHCQTHFGANTVEVTVTENHHSLSEDSSWSAGCVRAVLVDHRILSGLLLFTCFMPHFQQTKTLIRLRDENVKEGIDFQLVLLIKTSHIIIPTTPK